MKKLLLALCFFGTLITNCFVLSAKWTVKSTYVYSGNDIAKHDNSVIVTYIKGDSRRFTTVNAAVSTANSLSTASTVVVYVAKNPVVSKSFTINSGVTLLLSYDISNPESVSTSTPDVNGTYSTNSSISQSSLSGSLIVSSTSNTESTSIINYGTIEVGGVLSGGTGGGDYAGQTAGAYSQIVLGDNTNIINRGTINCYGYIKNGSYNASNKTFVYTNDKIDSRGYISNISGTFNMPFILRDYRGGTTTAAIYYSIDRLKIPAFNQIELRNVMCKNIFDLNSKCIGWANLYTGKTSYTSAQVNSTSVYLFGLPSGSLNSVIEPNSNCSDFQLISYYFESTQVQEIYLYGGAKTNSMTLSIYVPFIGSLSISTADVYFPLSFRQNIYLYKSNSQSSATYSMLQLFKIMPGSSLLVGENVTLEASNMCVYDNDDFIDDSSVTIGGRHYPSNKGAGNLTVLGTFKCATFGGYIKAEKENAIVNITNATSVLCYEAKTQNTSSFLPTGYYISDTINISKTLSLDSITYYDQNIIEVEENIPIGQYQSVARDNKYAFITSKTNYRINYINVAPDESFDENKLSYTNCLEYFNLSTNSSSLMPTYEGGEYQAVGAYLDDSYSVAINSIVGTNVFNYLNDEKELNIYIKWKKSETDVYKVDYNYYEKDTNNWKSYTIEDVNIGEGYVISNPSDYASGEYTSSSKYKFTYNFNGWLLSGDTYQSGDTLGADLLRTIAISNGGVINIVGSYNLKTYIWYSITNADSNSHSSVEAPTASGWLAENATLTVKCGAPYTSRFLFFTTTYIPTVVVTIGGTTYSISSNNSRTFSVNELKPAFNNLLAISIVGSWQSS